MCTTVKWRPPNPFSLMPSPHLPEMALPGLIIWFILLHCHRTTSPHRRLFLLLKHACKTQVKRKRSKHLWHDWLSTPKLGTSFVKRCKRANARRHMFLLQPLMCQASASSSGGSCRSRSLLPWSSLCQVFSSVALLTTSLSSVFFLQVTWRTWGRATAHTPNQTGSKVFTG